MLCASIIPVVVLAQQEILGPCAGTVLDYAPGNSRPADQSDEVTKFKKSVYYSRYDSKTYICSSEHMYLSFLRL